MELTLPPILLPVHASLPAKLVAFQRLVSYLIKVSG
jgi:hypothetical protein